MQKQSSWKGKLFARVLAILAKTFKYIRPNTNEDKSEVRGRSLSGVSLTLIQDLV